MPEKYIERPPTIDAVQFTGSQECADQVNNWLSSYGGVVTYDAPRDRLIIQTNNGFMIANNGDWVLMDNKLAVSVMTNENFENKYVLLNPEEVSEEPPEEVPGA